MGQAIASSSLVSPAAAAQPNSEIAEKTFEATADNVVNTLEAAYGVNRGKRRNHTKGFGALGIFVGAPEAAEYSRSLLFSGQEIEVVARFSLAGGDPEASDTEKSPRGLGLQFRLPGGSLHHITRIHTPMFCAMMPKTFLDKFLARTHQGPVRWDMLVKIGQPGDSEDDPTILWPNNRKEVRAGTLTLSSAMPDPKAGSYKINFDPLMMADGIEATNDPILLFRSPSYAVSHTRRLRDL